jgi:hypothetical protein
MAATFQNTRSLIRSVRAVREILVVEPVQQHHGRHAILLPPGTQCSIGSSRACTLTVSAQAILPQHCLIVSGPNSTILKEFGESTWLNDRPVREPIELMDNDRLAVGPAEFRIRAAHPEEIESAMPLEDGEQDEDSDPSVWRAQQGDLERHQSKLQKEAAQLDNREQSLVERESELNTKFEELDEKLSALAERDNSQSGAAARELDAQLLRLTTDHEDKKKKQEGLSSELEKLEIEKKRQAERQQAIDEKQFALDRKQAEVANRELDLEHQKTEFKLRTQEIAKLRDT